MAIDSFNQLFMQMARDVYSAEKQHAKALPKIAKQAVHPELQRAFEQHLEETHDQIARLESIFEMMGERPNGQKCEAAEGLIAEAQEIMGEVEEEPLKDAAMIAAAQAMEHYEIARYGTLLAWAEMMGNRDAARMLDQTLLEEERADKILNRLAEDMINAEAMRIDGSQPKREPAPSRGKSQKRRGGGRGQKAKSPRQSRSSGRQSGSGGRQSSRRTSQSRASNGRARAGGRQQQRKTG